MTSKALSSSSAKEFRKVYLWTLKSNKGLTILYTVLCFIALPFILLMETLSWGPHYENIYNILVISAPLAIIFNLIFSLNAFTYMHKKRKVDLFHSLPVKRTTLFLGKYCAVVTMLAAPLILNFGIALLISPLSAFTASDAWLILQRMFWILFFTVVIAAFCAFFAICCGTTLDAVVSIGVISVFYPLTLYLGIMLMGVALPGFFYDGSAVPTYISALSPFMAFIVACTGTTDASFLIWWLCFTAVLLIGSILLYRRRKSESAESAFTFPLPVIIRFIGSFAAALGVGIIFFDLFNNNSGTSNNLYFGLGALIGSLLVHTIIEAVYSRGFKKLKRSLIYYAAFVVVFIGAYVSVSTGFFGYDSYIPNADTVESISIEPTYTFSIGLDYVSQTQNTHYIWNNKGRTTFTPTLTDKKDIEKVTELHKMFYDDFRLGFPFPYQIRNDLFRYSSGDLIMKYTLKNGQILQRRYYLSQDDETRSSQLNLIHTISDSEEFKKSSSVLFHLAAKDIYNIQTSTSDFRHTQGTTSNTLTLNNLSEEVKQEMLDALKKDILEDTSEKQQLYKDSETALYVTINSEFQSTDNDSPTYFDPQVFKIPNYYKNTKAVLTKYGWDNFNS